MQTYSNISKHIQTYSNIFKTCPKHVQKSPKQLKHIQQTSKQFQNILNEDMTKVSRVTVALVIIRGEREVAIKKIS